MHATILQIIHTPLDRIFKVLMTHPNSVKPPSPHHSIVTNNTSEISPSFEVYYAPCSGKKQQRLTEYSVIRFSN